MRNLKPLVVIPAYNESSTISNVVHQCRQFSEVLVVDDGSLDETAEYAKISGALVIVKKINVGYDAALNSGYTYAVKNNFDIMLTIDADGQLPTSKIPCFLDEITSGADLVVGNRQKLSRLSEYLLSKISKLVLGIEDPYCGMKAYNLNACKNKTQFSEYNSVGTDLMFNMVSKGVVKSNVIVNVTPRLNKSKFGGCFASEIKLMPSLVIGVQRIIWMFVTGFVSRHSGKIKY